jgi:EmrB/QacA subfamily drug resistance transporter
VVTLTTAAPVVRRPALALAILVTCQMMLILDATVMNVALPRVQADLHFTPAGLSWVLNAYTLVFGCLLLLGGRSGDVFGRRTVFIVGVGLFTLASLACGLATSAPMLIVARVVQGLGAALAGPSTLALITTTFSEPKARVRALAVLSMIASAGLAVGMIVGGVLTEWFGWRAVLFINVPFGLGIVLLTPRFVPAVARTGRLLDVPGAVLATAGVGALVYGSILVASSGWAAAAPVLLLGFLLICVFLVVEARTRQPLLPLRLFADRDRAAAYACVFFGALGMLSMFFFLTQYLQNALKFSPLLTGVAFLPMAAGMFTMARSVPRLLPRFGAKRMALTGLALMTVGVAWLTQLSAGYLAAILGPLVLMGIGGGLAFPPMNVVVMTTAPAADAGAAGGTMQTMQQVGGTLGLAVLVTVAGTAGSFLDGLSRAFAAAAGAVALAFVIAVTFRSSQQKGGRTAG